MRINKKYIISFLILFIIEALIALFVHDNFIRPYIGDILVIILMYTFIRGVIDKKIKILPIYLFLFALFVEVMQYFKVIELLNLENNKVASIIMGTSFDIKDILCYFIGSMILIIYENISLRINKTF
ncbi:DUF2809 domain-containing protein [Clostridium sp. C8]|uniref:ribosomal maturation YjgA family protein n=1 Tax=Clostridium sp. C8 TaxID=1667357 RepID=UPI00062E76E1|nr:DUF2809 domain-containing protein [Clostridium sp. C8]KLE16535.1 membrane protein [Clostridium sp. C8]